MKNKLKDKNRCNRKQQEFGQIHMVEKLTDGEKEIVMRRKNETNIMEC